jgi:hypothetical protein
MASVFEFFLNFTYINLFETLIVLIFSFAIFHIIKSTNFRKKTIVFFILLIAVCIWGMWASFDLFIFFLAATEFFVVLLFLLLNFMYSVKISHLRLAPNFKYFFFATVAALYFFSLTNAFTGYTQQNYYVYLLCWDIIRLDLFIFFHFFYVSNWIFTFYLIMIISLFSVAFIWLYFALKRVTTRGSANTKAVSIIRSQHLMHQGVHKPRIKIFQKKN